MGFFSKIFNKKKENENVGGMEDFMTLIRVYMQGSIAARLGITNLSAFPEMAAFKRTLKVATINNKLGLGEKKTCGKMLSDIYGISESFFSELDNSIKKGCRNPNDVRSYMYLFQGYSQELMMLMGNLMKWKFRIPSFFQSLLKKMTEQTIEQIFTKDVWTDEATRKSVYSVRTYQQRLGLSKAWATEFVYNMVRLAKKEPKPSQEQIDSAKEKLNK